MLPPLRFLLRNLLFSVFGSACAIVCPAYGGPVALRFEPPRSSQSPHAREISAMVTTPSGRTIELPAFHSGRQIWEVRARGDESGIYRINTVNERIDGTLQVIAAHLQGDGLVTVHAPGDRKSVLRAPGDPTRFAFSDGMPYSPIGANLAWAPVGRGAWYIDALRRFGDEGLNWTRVWMCHWGGTNLDWLPDDMGRSPRPGGLDARVAATWDTILDAAEKHGVYVQVVLQHHGQYTTGANTNWAVNPWNAANRGGFLKTPGDFFTSPQAIALTKQKYRYIVARWAHSPAILAWELFNEVHWTNAYRDDDNEAAVAAWHTEMADYIRSIDPYDHLVTTSLDDIHSPIYASMDFLQPHLYAINMLTSVRRFEQPFEAFDRPMFYGEIGDDKIHVSAEDKATGVQIVPQVWASLMGAGPLPGQTWLGELLVKTDRVSELGAVARFMHATGIATREDLTTFSPAVTGDDRMPLRFISGYDWAIHRPTGITLPLDGSDALDAAELPSIIVGSAASVEEGYPASVKIRLTVPRDTTATLAFGNGGARGAAARILVDGTEVASHVWPRLPDAPAHGPQPPDAPVRPARLIAELAAGERTLEIRNTGGEDWIQLDHIDLTLDTPVLAAAGKRDDRFIALWVWNKIGVHAPTPESTATASLILPDVPAGDWQVTWWDAVNGRPGAPASLRHAGGTLHLPTPPIDRHAAVVLTLP